MKPKSKKTKPVDSTMRNVKAANRRFEIIDERLNALAEQSAMAWRRIDQLNLAVLTMKKAKK